MTSLFIGVVSYTGSRFSVSQGPEGLAARLVAPLEDLGVRTHVTVRTDDALDESRLPVTTDLVRASLRQKLRLEREWQAYLRQGHDEPALARIRRSAALAFWRVHTEITLVRPWQPTLGADAPATRAVRRLLNIELSHIALLEEAVSRGDDWVLILEDDAATRDLDDCASGLSTLVTLPDGPPDYVNVSQSHTYRELGIEHLLAPTPVVWGGSAPRRILSAARPVTNTVCAILYRRPFATRILEEFAALPMEPVVPIDWKLDLALMRMFRSGELADGSCWVVDPAPIDQLSMR